MACQTGGLAEQQVREVCHTFVSVFGYVTHGLMALSSDRTVDSVGGTAQDSFLRTLHTVKEICSMHAEWLQVVVPS